jgi:GT2 family glycosyltransferase
VAALSELTISVIVVTYGRNETMADTLADLARQDYPRYEVIVVDQNDPSIADLPEGVHHVKLQPPHMCVARNVGIRSSAGDLVVFVDDDVRVGETFLREHAAAYRRPDTGAVGGWVDADQQEHAWKPAGPTVDKPIGCNMSFRREALEQVGGFDCYFKAQAAYGDEKEIAHRVRQRGWKIAVASKAQAFHRVHPTGGLRHTEPIGFWRDFVSNQALVFLKTKPLWQRLLYRPWLERLRRTVGRLSDGALDRRAFKDAEREGRRLLALSRANPDYLSQAPDGRVDQTPSSDRV